MNAPESPPIRLTELAHGGGCGCKVSPGVLREILANAGGAVVPPQLLVGIETSDDAAVYELNERQAVVATTDFFMPIVDDPFDFGAIAATNALSDVYAMGATPIFALAIVGMPVAKLPQRRFAGFSTAANPYARAPEFRSPAVIRSTRSSRSTAWSRSASSLRRGSSGTPARAPAIRSSSASRSASASTARR
jgi:selenophosphate synthase